MFWNPEVITTTGKSLRITQIQFNIIYIMRTNINQGRIQSLAVMIVPVADGPGKFLHQRRYQ